MKRCTMCGKKLDTVDLYGDFSFRHRVGYGSKHDGDVVCLTLCSDCFDRVVDILSMMSKEKIVFSPQELSENGGYYEKRVKERCRYSPPLGSHRTAEPTVWRFFRFQKQKNPMSKAK